MNTKSLDYYKQIRKNLSKDYAFAYEKAIMIGYTLYQKYIDESIIFADFEDKVINHPQETRKDILNFK